MDDLERFDQTDYKHWVEDRVRFSDLDPLGHVNNKAVSEYFENARALLFMEVTPNWPKRDDLFVLAHLAIDYRRELHFPSPLKIGTQVLSFGRTSMKMASAVFRDSDGIAYCESVSVLINQKTRKPVEISHDLRKILMVYGTT